MASDDAKSIIQNFQALWQAQANFRSLWNTTAQYVLPAYDNFIGEFAEGVNRNTRIFDSTAILACDRFTAIMEDLLTPRAQTWHKLTAADEELEDHPAVQKYLDQVNKLLFGARYHPQANFASQTVECYSSVGAFGNSLMFIDEITGQCLEYRAVPLSEIVWALNHQGAVDTVGRKFKYSAKQAVDHWGEEHVPESIKRVYASANPYQEMEFLHFIRPNQEWIPGSYGDRGKRFESWYIFLGDQSVLERGCYRTFPCAIGRYRVAPRENYGRGPATTCLPDIRTANEMMKTALRQGQKAVDPPLLLAEESVINTFNQRPGAINYGMMTQDGKPLAVPFESKANWELGEQQLEQTRQVIRDTFLYDLWKALTENPDMTATMSLQLARERAEIVAPIMGRGQSEFLGPMIVREIDIMSEAGQLPPPPIELLRSKGGAKILYTSPMANAMRAEEGTAIMNTVSDLAQMANLDKSVLYLMDFHDAGREMAAIRGCPAKLIRSEDQVQALLEHAAQQTQDAQQAQQAPQVAMGVKNLAQAAQAAGQAGTGQPAAQPVPA